MPRRTNTQVSARVIRGKVGGLCRVQVNCEQVGLESLAEAAERLCRPDFSRELIPPGDPAGVYQAPACVQVALPHPRLSLPELTPCSPPIALAFLHQLSALCPLPLVSLLDVILPGNHGFLEDDLLGGF